MQIEFLTGKIHRATVTQAELDYVGSITIDRALAQSAHIAEYQKVHVANVTNGKRLETYVIYGEEGSGIVCMNGAAAHCARPGDLVIIMAYALMSPEEAALPENAPYVVFVDGQNVITSVDRYEQHGKI